MITDILPSKEKELNLLKAKITDIESSDSISIVTADFYGIDLCAVLIDTPITASYLEVGNEVSMIFKETEVSIGRGLIGELSMRNRIPAIILSIQKGRIMSQIKMEAKGQEIISVISTGSVNRMKLVEGENVEAIIKSNEVFVAR